MINNMYALRKGDMFVNSRWAAILTRKTRKYWYFRWSHNPQEGRVPIKKLWRHIDTGSLALHYRSSMKYRRKKAISIIQLLFDIFFDNLINIYK